MIAIVLLTFNSAASIGRTLDSLAGLSDDIHVVDSFSTDETVALCRARGARVVQRAFKNYAEQRNWAIANLTLRHSWQLHVDADEELEPSLRDAIAALDLGSSTVDGYLLCRKIVFLGHVLRFTGIARTWHMRLFRTGRGRCEDRLYDQHFVCDGPVASLPGAMLDHQEGSLSEWTIRHNRWSDLESAEVARGGGAVSHDGQVRPRLNGNPIERRRFQKGLYYRTPLLLRPIIYFLLRYVFQLGFLDGRPGLIYHVLQALWFRFLVDAKIVEAQYKGLSETVPESIVRRSAMDEGAPLG